MSHQLGSMSNTTNSASAARIRAVTPIKAITTVSTIRSTPLIPSASDGYEPIIKSILRQKFLHKVLIRSWLFTWSSTTLWAIWTSGGYKALGVQGILTAVLWPWTLMSALLFWTAGVLPSIVLHKVCLTDHRTPANSPSHMWNLTIRKKETSRIFTTYIISALTVASIYAFLTSARGSSPSPFNLFVKSRKHPRYLNGRLVFLFLSQLSLATLYSLRVISRDAFAFQWVLAHHSSLRGRGNFLKCTTISLILAVISVPVAAAFFVVFRPLLPLLYKIWFIKPLLRPFIGHFLRAPWTIVIFFSHAPLILRTLPLVFATALAWELASSTFHVFVTERISVSPLVSDPNVTLVAGISSKDHVYRYFAFAELRDIASSEEPSDASRRTALFGDQKYNPNLWSQLVREGLIVLGRDYQHFLRRGQPEPTPVPVAIISAEPPKIPFPATHKPIFKKNIYQKQKESPMKNVVESLAADGSFIKALDEGAEATHLPEIFRSVEKTIIPAPVKAEVLRNVEEAQSFFGTINDRIRAMSSNLLSKVAPEFIYSFSAGAQKWWSEERTSKIVENCLSFRELDVVITETLSHLVCASLTEDRYGVVQRDIPRILEAFLSYLDALESYQATVSSLYDPPEQGIVLPPADLAKSEELRMEIEKANEALSFLADGLKDGIARIVRTFGDKLLAFKFPPQTASKLQGFLDYC